MKKSIFTREYQAVTNILTVLRKKAGVTQVELAEMLGQSQSFVSKYERGDRRLDVIQLRTVCQTLGSSLPAFAKLLETALSNTSGRRSK